MNSGKTDNRPKFLSKKERDELKKKEEEEQQQKDLQKKMETNIQRKEFLEKPQREREEKEDDRKRKPRRDRSHSRSRSRERSRSKENDRHNKSSSKATTSAHVDSEDAEIQSIKNQYLGLNKDKKRLVKPSERFKNTFNFEWEDSEDTSADVNSFYAQRPELSILFGKGRLGGVDVLEQKHKADKTKEEDKMDNEAGLKSKYSKLGDTIHWSQKTLDEMSDRDWRIFREDHDIIPKGGRVPAPIRGWEEANLPDFIMEPIRSHKFKKPTPIQMQAIPIGIERKDLMGIAPTGSGKTAAYLIPLIIYLNSLPPINGANMDDGPYGLIMCPTRELALQVFQDFEKFAIATRLKAQVVVGGKSIEEQAFNIRKGVELIIATPGRMQDALESRYTVLNQCSYVVVDEADKMVEMGFEEILSYILDSIPKTNLKSNDEALVELQERKSKNGQSLYRITHMFSATMPTQVEKIARKYLRCPAYISIGEPGASKKEIDQRVELIQEGDKKHRLRAILNKAEGPIIIFLNEKRAVEFIAQTVEKWGWKAVIYHGGKTQDQREKAVEDFKAKKYDILVATDLAGRGLDVEGVKYVINFDAPKSLSDFIHRTGRTGRAGKKGIAYTFLTNKNEEIFYDLKNFLAQNNLTIPQELENHPASKVKPGALEYVPRRKQVIFAQ